VYPSWSDASSIISDREQTSNSPEHDGVLTQGWSSGECQRLKSDIYLSLSFWHSTSITNFPQENLLSEAFSLTILSFTVFFDSSLIIYSMFIFYFEFGVIIILEFTSLYGVPVRGGDCLGRLK